MTPPLPLTAVLVEHEDHWTGWITELPEVEHQAPTREAVTEALPSLALAALTHREPDFRIRGGPPTLRRRWPVASRQLSRLLGRMAPPRRTFEAHTRTPRLQRCRTRRLRH